MVYCFISVVVFWSAGFVSLVGSFFSVGLVSSFGLVSSTGDLGATFPTIICWLGRIKLPVILFH